MERVTMHIKSETKLPGWTIAGRTKRTKFMSKGFIPAEGAEKHGVGVTAKVGPYRHPTFSQWQTRLAGLLHEGSKDVILDIATSCGKTWATNLSIAHEVFQTDNATAIIVTPNIEVIREGMRDIMVNHVKKYRFPQNRMTDSITRKYSTYEENHMPGCQIMMLTPDTFVEFITCGLNQDFIRRMRFLVFDEVHLKSVAHTLWWSTHIPHTAQLVLLSATIGNIEEFKRFSKRPVEIINYHVRPIPLQYVLYRPPIITATVASGTEGFAPASLVRAGHLSLETNIADPTGRDLKSLDRTREVPASRDEQYTLARELMTPPMIDKIGRDLKQALETATTGETPENIYNLLSYLFANGMQPAMVFFRTGEQVRTMLEKITSHIISLETSDPDWKANQKTIDQYERKRATKRDAKTGKRSEEWDEWDEQYQEQQMHDEMNVLYDYARKWRLPQTVSGLPNNVPQWIKTAVEYGMGVYISSMPMYLKHFMFDEFKKGNITAMFADSSISVGINLPIRTVILCGDDISDTLFRQAAGRAGRRGMDTQGYVIPLMSKDRIYDIFTSREQMTTVEIQPCLTFSDLCRLNTPNNLDIYYTDDRFVDKPDAVCKIKQQILTSYMRNHAGDQERRQLELVKSEQWHYHKLTNLVKSLPEQESIVFLKLLTTGALHRLEPMQFIKLIQLIFCRLPGDATVASEFDPKFIAGIEIFIRHYGLRVDIKSPVDDYFVRYCRGEKLDQSYSENIERIGDWIYILRKGLESIAPKEDAFRVIVEKTDAMFLMRGAA